MTLKRWVLWLCIIALVISELMLFSANQQKNKALAEARDAQNQLAQITNELSQGESSTTEAQNVEVARFHSEHQDLLRLRNTVREVTETNRVLMEQLRAAHTLLQQQQTELQGWRMAGQQAEQEMQAAQKAQQQPPQPAPSENPATAAAQRRACINNLRRIDAAKQQWALENNKTDDAVPTVADLLPYFRDGVFPSCPAGGLYSINAVGLPPTCSIPGHALPQ